MRRPVAADLVGGREPRREALKAWRAGDCWSTLVLALRGAETGRVRGVERRELGRERRC